MRLKNRYYIFILFSILFAGCKKSYPPFGPSDFPVKVGDTWTYQRYDSITQKTDTIVWSLPTTVNINGKLIYVWTQTSATQSDTGYWAINDDTITLYAKGIMYGATDYFIFPVQNGSKWSETPLGGAPDQYICSGTNSVTIKNINYNNVFILNRMQSGLDASVIENIDLAKGIGILVYTIHNVNQGQVSIYQLSLINYTLY